MRRYTTAHARAHLAELLNAAETGTPVVIERRGVRFVLHADRTRRRTTKRTPVIEWVDPVVLNGRWTWAGGRRGLRFVGRGRWR